MKLVSLKQGGRRTFVEGLSGNTPIVSREVV